ncbi:hypothetical protein E2C01_095841 [Portunus trituberculatus]|uniref:Uncharacterized protein n=1 Tax=Portunus trituberculatus TaxID=210409 RepID=A0A5B7K172_PORTR|nr:hypothetical protein [Portunus trituberculatus]
MTTSSSNLVFPSGGVTFVSFPMCSLTCISSPVSLLYPCVSLIASLRYTKDGDLLFGLHMMSASRQLVPASRQLVPVSG